MPRKFRYARIGTVSEATLRDEDLIDSFSWELKSLAKGNPLSKADRRRVRETLQDVHEYNPDEPDSLDYDPSELVSELSDCLELFAPPYAYFGTLEGDGACFGFWPNDIQDMQQENYLPTSNGDCDDAGFYLDHDGERIIGDLLVVNDHGNVTCGRQDKRGKFHEYWSVV